MLGFAWRNPTHAVRCEAAPNSTLLEKHAAPELASFKEANVHIIGFAKKRKEKNSKLSSHVEAHSSRRQQMI